MGEAQERGRLSQWRDTAGLDEAKARELAARLELLDAGCGSGVVTRFDRPARRAQTHQMNDPAFGFGSGALQPLAPRGLQLCSQASAASLIT